MIDVSGSTSTRNVSKSLFLFSLLKGVTLYRTIVVLSVLLSSIFCTVSQNLVFTTTILSS